MTDPPEQRPSEQPSSDPAPEAFSSARASRRWRRVLLYLGLGVGLTGAVGAVVFAIWGKRIVTALLLPRVADSIDEAINRPVELGDVEGFTFWGARLGETVVPPTETDETTITIEAIEVSIGLRSLLLHQIIRSDIVLIRPDVKLAQQEDGTWTDFELPEPSETEQRIELEIQSIEVRDAQLNAVPFVEANTDAVVPATSIEANDIDAIVEFYGEEANEVAFTLNTDVKDGSAYLNGHGNLDNQTVKTSLRTESLPIAGVNMLLPDWIGLTAGELDSNLTLTAALDDGKLNEDALDVTGIASVRVDEARLQQLPEPARDIRSRIRFQGQSAVAEDTRLELGDIFVTAQGKVDLKDGYALTAQVPEVSIDQVTALTDVSLPVVASGGLQLDVDLTGGWKSPLVAGRLANLSPVLIDQLSFETVAAEFDLRRTDLQLDSLLLQPTTGGNILAEGNADLSDLENPTFDLLAEANVPADAIALAYGANLPADVTIGTVTAEVVASGDLQDQSAIAEWRLTESSFPGAGRLALVGDQVLLEDTLLQVSGGTVAAEGLLNLPNGDWRLATQAQDVSVGQFTDRLIGQLNSDIVATGNIDALRQGQTGLAQIDAQGTATVANAQLQLPQIDESIIEQGDWFADFSLSGDRLIVSTFDAPGIQAKGFIDVDLANASLENPTELIRNVDFDVVASSLNLRPINSFIPAQAREYGRLAGFVGFNGRLSGPFANLQLLGQANINDLSVSDIVFEPLSGPVAFSLQEGGTVDLRGRTDEIRVTLDPSPNRPLPFWPTAFNLQNGDFIASSTTRGDDVQVEVAKLPLTRLNFPANVETVLGEIGGNLTASVDINLADFSNPVARGRVAIADPEQLPIEADSLTANFAYDNGIATVDNGELLFGDSRYLLAAEASLRDGISYDGTITVDEGRVEDLIPIVNDLNLSAFGFGSKPAALGTAAALAAVEPVGLPPGNLLERLEYFAEFVAANPPNEEEPSEIVLPPIEDLEGEFSGVIAFSGNSLSLSDATADVDLRGDSWVWGPYDEPNEFVLDGTVGGSGFDVETAVVNAGSTAISLTGGGSFDALDAQVTVSDLPVIFVELFYPLPGRFTGDIDLVANLDGSLANPTVDGDVLIVDTRVNEYPIEQVLADFSYRDAVLSVDSEIAIDATDAPMTVAGKVPYVLPFMRVAPASDQIDIRAFAPSDSLEVVNALADGQVLWEGGEGEIVAEVGGTLAEPLIDGVAKFEGGAVRSDRLEDALTDLTGEVRFTSQALSIPQLQANVGEGRIAIAGQLPLLPSGQSVLTEFGGVLGERFGSQPNRLSSNPPILTIEIENVALDYEDSISAVLAGQLQITEAALSPKVTGIVAINDGVVQANQLLGDIGSLNLPTTEEVNEISPYRAEYLGVNPLAPRPPERPPGILDSIVLQNLEIVLGDRLLIVGQPFYRLSAAGGLTVSGPASNLQPVGTIALESGWVNLLSTQFRLDRGAPNTATFVPGGGLDPILDVTLTAIVRDTQVEPPPRLSNGFMSAYVTEQSVDQVGRVEFIDVQAIVQGPVSEIEDNLMLTSEPPQSERELLALVSGDVVTNVAGASLTQLASFAGGGSLTTFGDRIADAIGLQSFSVFPTADTTGDSSIDIGIAVEATASISDRFDISLLEILNSSTPPQLGIEYRLSDEFTLQGESNLDETEFELEYRINF